MIDLFLLFWTIMILSSICWYGFLVFYVGAKGGKEIKEMTEALSARANPEHKAKPREIP